MHINQDDMTIININKISLLDPIKIYIYIYIYITLRLYGPPILTVPEKNHQQISPIYDYEC